MVYDSYDATIVRVKVQALRAHARTGATQEMSQRWNVRLNSGMESALPSDPAGICPFCTMISIKSWYGSHISSTKPEVRGAAGAVTATDELTRCQSTIREQNGAQCRQDDENPVVLGAVCSGGG